MQIRPLCGLQWMISLAHAWLLLHGWGLICISVQVAHEKLTLRWLPCHTPGVIGSVLGVCGMVWVYCAWCYRVSARSVWYGVGVYCAWCYRVSAWSVWYGVGVLCLVLESQCSECLAWCGCTVTGVTESVLGVCGMVCLYCAWCYRVSARSVWYGVGVLCLVLWGQCSECVVWCGCTVPGVMGSVLGVCGMVWVCAVPGVIGSVLGVCGMVCLYCAWCYRVSTRSVWYGVGVLCLVL